MKVMKYVSLLLMVLCTALYVPAQENDTEVQGFYQTYRNFSFRTGSEFFDITDSKLNGGGFSLSQNLAPWFAMWTQLSFYGSVEQPYIRIRAINNLQGIRFQTLQHGPFRLYAKGGLGFSHHSIDVIGSSYGEYKFSFAYGGGAQIWMSDHFGVVLDLSHVMMGLPTLFDLPGREKWDSGLTYTTGISVRF
jgi:hypothetical protein